LNQYEAMFLFDPTYGAAFENCEAEIHRLMERAKAEIVFCKKWDERRLAYRIKGRKRGVYVLTYFNAPSDRLGSLERDVQISENILRALILRADGVTLDMMEKAIATRGADTTPGEGAAGAPPERVGAPSVGSGRPGRGGFAPAAVLEGQGA
jgi:ribosomal protein S6